MTDTTVVPRYYFIGHDDENGDSMDLLVEAFSPAQAVLLWRDYFEGGITKSDLYPAGMFLVPLPSGQARAVPWHDSVIHFGMQSIPVPTESEIAAWQQENQEAAA